MTARDRKRRIHALLSRWETIRFANSEKECVEDFAAMIVDLEDRLAQYRVIPALPATPAPLDVALCDCGHGYPSYGIGKAKHLPECHYGIIADWLADHA